MKKLLSVILLTSILLSCCACGKEDAVTEPPIQETLDPSSPEGMFGHIDQTKPVDGVYKIWNAEGVENMVNHPDGHFELLCDVDMQGATLQPIGSDEIPFTGVIEGGNYNILNFTLQGGDDENFGFVAVNRGKIQNIRFQNVIFLTGTNVKNAGGFAGDNQGSISRCYISGAMTVEAASEGGAFGALTGINSGDLANTIAAVDLVVNAPESANVGGIVGVTKGGGVQYVDTEGKLTITGSNKTVGLFAGMAEATVFTSCAFLGADNSLDGKLFTNFTGNADDDELAVAVEGRWRDNDIEPMPENVAKLRDTVVNRMYEMGSVEWHVDKELLHDCKCGQNACIGVYTPDYTYIGMPYKHGSATWASFNYWLDDNNFVEDWSWDMDSRFGYDTYMGTMCTSAAETAWWTVCNSVDAPIPEAFFPYYEGAYGAIQVGDKWWEDSTGYNPSKPWTDIYIDNVTEQEYFEIITQVHRGDMLNQGIEAGVHTVMVASEPVIVRDQQGLIDGDRSYLTTHEQCGGAQIDDEKMTWTSWRLDKKRTFTSLRNNWWLPSTCEELITGEMETPECTILDGAEGRLGLTTGIVKANYFLEVVYLKITDADGNVILDKPFFPKSNKFDDANQRLVGIAYVDSYDLANCGMALQSIMFEPGETYSYTISAHLMTGDDFLVKTDSFTQGGTK